MESALFKPDSEQTGFYEHEPGKERAPMRGYSIGLEHVEGKELRTLLWLARQRGRNAPCFVLAAQN